MEVELREVGGVLVELALARLLCQSLQAHQLFDHLTLARTSGLRPIEAALEDEGFDDLGSGRLVESFARQLMVLIDAWQESGFDVVAQSYLTRLPAELGMERTIDGVGDLLMRRKGKLDVKKHRLLPALAAPSWLDPATGGPR